MSVSAHTFQSNILENQSKSALNGNCIELQKGILIHFSCWGNYGEEQKLVLILLAVDNLIILRIFLRSSCKLLMCCTTQSEVAFF